MLHLTQAGEKWRKKTGCILDPKARPQKKHFSIFDEIPEELIEKRRSSRKPVAGSAVNSSETSQEVVTRGGAQDPRWAAGGWLASQAFN